MRVDSGESYTWLGTEQEPPIPIANGRQMFAVSQVL